MTLQMLTAILIQKKKATKKINFRLRDAIFSRQRYWNLPCFYKNNTTSYKRYTGFITESGQILTNKRR